MSGFCCPVPGFYMRGWQGYNPLPRITLSRVFDVPAENTTLNSRVLLFPMFSKRCIFESSEGASFLWRVINWHKLFMIFNVVGPVGAYLPKVVLPRWTARD